jgi:hypothetical protein
LAPLAEFFILSCSLLWAQVLTADCADFPGFSWALNADNQRRLLDPKRASHLLNFTINDAKRGVREEGRGGLGADGVGRNDKEVLQLVNPYPE